MTDVANVQWPEDMVVEDVTFREGWTQARDEFGMGFIQFDKTGKIITVEYSDSCYGNVPSDDKVYSANIKNFTGILDMVDFAIVAIQGQLVFGFGVAFPTALNILTKHYHVSRNWEDMPEHFASLKEDEVEHFKAALDHYIKGLSKPLTEKLTFEDLIDINNPLLVTLQEEDRAYWIDLSEEVRSYYQTGNSDKDEFALHTYYDNAPIKHRNLPK